MIKSTNVTTPVPLTRPFQCRPVSKNKNMHSLIDNCSEIHFRLLRAVLRSFIRHNTTELFLFFCCT